ncbi:polyhomeotic-like protein 3 isoform X2 [Thalassophryne amazonica]|uniref:polyhomeotic-like protein 3 isoform X2 n=1 Tax=Thalassophryne amazonica TaxID=390379 RepID=UPI00147104CA|nr:polyhomeotic-like protein 3 isoform X2 [Thalassophryne amazonica]
MDRELVQQSQPEHSEATNGTSTLTTVPDSSAPKTPTPPRLTPNPMLLDSPAPTLTPTTSSPPPPLTPAPSISATPGPKASQAMAAVGALSPHILIPAPPKLTSMATPALCTYSRPILPSPAAISKPPSSPTTQTSSSSAPLPPSSPSSAVVSASSPHLSTPSATHSNTTMPTNATPTLANGNTRPLSTTISAPITPFHTPASPPGRQASQTHPVGTPGLVRANQNPLPVRQRVSQQALLLGKGLKGSGQDQVLLRAQMLQSLTLRPPPPGTLAIPPSLRLKTPSSAPPPFSRPHAPVFPPLRPRPQPNTTATETLTTPSRHLSVPPPTLYSPVRAVPLRPRLHSPNSHKAASPRQASTLQPIAAAAAAGAAAGPPVSRSMAGPKSCALSQSLHRAGQSQHSSIPVTNMPVTSHFERSASAARQLQIIALSSGRQTQPGTYTHASVQSTPRTVKSPDLPSQSQRTVSSDDMLPLKMASPLPSPPPLPSPSSPPSQAGPHTHLLLQKGELKDGDEQRVPGRLTGPRQVFGDTESVGQDLRVERDDQRKQEMEQDEKKRLKVEKQDISICKTEQKVKTGREDEPMEVTEEGHSEGERVEGEERRMEEEGGTTMDKSENPASHVLHQYHKLDPNPIPDSIQDSSTEPKHDVDLVSAPIPVQTVTVAPVPIPPSVPEASVQSQRLPESHRDLQSINQEDFCENMSTQSDNQSALSSLSSQSPPSSPFVAPSVDNPPPLFSTQTTSPADLRLINHEPQNDHKTVGQSHHLSETENEHLGQSEDESQSFNQPLTSPWEPRAWPEGRQVLTHLVEGFVIQEGLQPFPVNRSSLLVPDQVTKPPEVNGTNGKAVLPEPRKLKETQRSTDSDEDGGDTDDLGSRSSHRDRAVLHCQFCGKRGHAHNFMRSKRFCSTSCARGFNVRLTKRLRALSAGSRTERPRPSLNRAEVVPGKPLLLRLPRDLWSAGRREKEGKEKRGEEEEGGVEEYDDRGDGEEEDPAVAVTARMERRVARRARRASAPALTTSMPTTTFKPAPSQWSVEEVTTFIHMLPGCGDVAENFRLQEIDGQALLLLTEDHLMTSMNIKLGPALKICAHINALKNQ